MPSNFFVSIFKEIFIEVAIYSLNYFSTTEEIKI